MSDWIRLSASGKSKAEKSEITDCYTFGKEHPKYDVMRKSSVWYIKPKEGVAIAAEEPPKETAPKELKAPKTSPQNISETTLLENIIKINQDSAKERTKRKKLKARFNHLLELLEGKGAQQENVDEEEQIEPPMPMHQNMYAPPIETQFKLRRR